jgi:hypothetical protein
MINWLGVVLATLTAFVSGAIWFGPKTFFPVWWRAMGRTDDMQPGSGNMAVVFGSTFVGQFVQALVMALVIGKLGESGDVTVWCGLKTGLVLGLGLAAAPALSHRLFAGHGFKVWLIEVSNDVINLALMGAVIAAVS